MMSPNVATYQIVRRNRSRMSRWIPSRDEVASIAKTISGAADRLDQLDGVVVVDLPAQPPHQHLAHVWDENHDPFTNVLEVLVRRPRREIDDDHPAKVLQTGRGAAHHFRDLSDRVAA